MQNGYVEATKDYHNWKKEYGGGIEFWSKDLKNCVVREIPIFNKVVIFSTTSDSFHGHPDPLKCPENMSRKSIALYYYSNGRPKNEIRSKRDDLINQTLDTLLLNIREKEKKGGYYKF